MPRPLTVFLPVGPGAGCTVVAGDPGAWLPAPATAVGDAWVLSLHAGPVAHGAVCRVGTATHDGTDLWRPISWQASDAGGHTRAIDRLLPTFAGELGVVRAPSPTLVLTGSYDPPGSVVGSVADRAGLERVAQATARRFVSDVARRLAGLCTEQGKVPVALR